MKRYLLTDEEKPSILGPLVAIGLGILGVLVLVLAVMKVFEK